MLNRIPSIRKKQIVAVTGLMMVGFLLAHLTGNFLIFKGPEAYNAYAKFLHDLGGILWVLRSGIIAAFVLHVLFIVLIVKENRQARKTKYAVDADHTGKFFLPVKFMRISGVIILAYIVSHLLDFTFVNKAAHSAENGLGLYGLVVSELSEPLHAIWYLIAMFSIGIHLAHSLQSVFQTFGFVKRESLPKLAKISLVFGLGIAFAYSSIPLYIIANFR